MRWRVDAIKFPSLRLFVRGPLSTQNRSETGDKADLVDLALRVTSEYGIPGPCGTTFTSYSIRYVRGRRGFSCCFKTQEGSTRDLTPTRASRSGTNGRGCYRTGRDRRWFRGKGTDRSRSRGFHSVMPPRGGTTWLSGSARRNLAGKPIGDGREFSGEVGILSEASHPRRKIMDETSIDPHRHISCRGGVRLRHATLASMMLAANQLD